LVLQTRSCFYKKGINMNSKRNIVMAAVVVVTAMVLTTSWSVVTGESDDPNEIDPRGIWTGRQARGAAGEEQMAWVEVVGEEKHGTSPVVMKVLNPDPALFGLFPDVTTRTDSVGSWLRTGPNTWDYTYIGYGTTGTHEPGYGDVVWMLVYRGTATATDANTIVATGLAEIYSGRDDPNHPVFGELHDQDTDPRDGFPDADEEPLYSGAFEVTEYRLPMLPPPGAGLQGD
jgi:hypothetical protein